MASTKSSANESNAQQVTDRYRKDMPQYSALPSSVIAIRILIILFALLQLESRWKINALNDCGLAPLNKYSRRHSTIDIDRIINGSNANYGSWPSLVRIVSNEVFCNGVLVTKSHFITAGHCMTDLDRSGQIVPIKLAEIKVYLGENSLRQRDRYEQRRNVRGICLSPQFDRQELYHDFAVVTLDRPVDLNDHVWPACLPRTFASDDYKEDNDYNNSSQSENHNKSKSKSKSNSDTTDDNENNNNYRHCFAVSTGVVDKRYPVVWPRVVQEAPFKQVNCGRWSVPDESQFCWTKLGGPGDTCTGDSGAPILCLNTDDDRWTAVGVTSFGSPDCRGREPYGPVAVYTNLNHLRDIISAECSV